MNLTNLPLNQVAEVVRIQAAGTIRRRLLDMGIHKGIHLKIIHRAPLGDPIEIETEGFCVSLRLSEAGTISVKCP